MRERLNKRNSRYTYAFRVIVYFSEFGFCVSSAKMPEIRFALNFVNVFHIKPQSVVSHFLYKPGVTFNLVDFHNSVAGNV